MHRYEIPWSAEEDAHILQRWGAGDSGSKIAASLRGRTRNAVMGRLRRIGAPPKIVKPRYRDEDEPRKQPVKREPNPRKVILFAPDALDKKQTQRARPGKLVTLLALKADHCRFPIGDVGNADFGFCGSSRQKGYPYCVEHCRVAYQPPATRRVQGGDSERA